jgi:hypothetical protein
VSESDKNRGMLELASVLDDAFIVYAKFSGTFSTLNVPRNQGVAPKLYTESFRLGRTAPKRGNSTNASTIEHHEDTHAFTAKFGSVVRNVVQDSLQRSSLLGDRESCSLTHSNFGSFV